MPFWSKPPTPAGPTKATTMLPSSGENGIASKPPPLSREAQADAELAALMRELDAEHQANAAAAKHASVTHVTDDDKTGLPTDMNCLTAFDEMFYCYSLGGQFLNIYRYGGFQDCSEKSADWRFCMKSKVRGEVARRAMILARNKEKAAKYKMGKSSEDVWTVRKVPLTDAFSGGDMEEMTDGGLG